MTITFQKGNELKEGEFWWVYDRAEEGSDKYFEAQFDQKRRLQLKQVSPLVWEAEFTLETDKNTVDCFANFYRMANIAGEERRETISSPYTRVELK